jgi:hypothetical protein
MGARSPRELSTISKYSSKALTLCVFPEPLDFGLLQNFAFRVDFVLASKRETVEVDGCL